MSRESKQRKQHHMPNRHEQVKQQKVRGAKREPECRERMDPLEAFFIQKTSNVFKIKRTE